MSGQTRSNFEVGRFTQNWCLSDSVFDDEFNGGIFILVDGLELQKLPSTILSCVFLRCFWQFCDQKMTACHKIWPGHSKY